MKKGIIKINEARCKGCLLCIPVCKTGEIEKSMKVNKSGHQVVEFKAKGSCNACTLCAITCPDAAIEVFLLVEKDE